ADFEVADPALPTKIAAAENTNASNAAVRLIVPPLLDAKSLRRSRRLLQMARPCPRAKSAAPYRLASCYMRWSDAESTPAVRVLRLHPAALAGSIAPGARTAAPMPLAPSTEAIDALGMDLDDHAPLAGAEVGILVLAQVLLGEHVDVFERAFLDDLGWAAD